LNAAFCSGGELLDGYSGRKSGQLKRNGLAAEGAYEDILRSIEIFDMTRFLNHLPKVAVIKGDFNQTAPKYLENHPHLIVSLLYLDFNIHASTRKASWLNQVENWFAKLESNVIARGIFTSVRTWPVSSCATSVTTTALPSPSSGPIAPHSSHLCRYHFTCYRPLAHQVSRGEAGGKWSAALGSADAELAEQPEQNDH
jgi:hypothetical protein